MELQSVAGKIPHPRVRAGLRVHLRIASSRIKKVISYEGIGRISVLRLDSIERRDAEARMIGRLDKQTLQRPERRPHLKPASKLPGCGRSRRAGLDFPEPTLSPPPPSTSLGLRLSSALAPLRGRHKGRKDHRATPQVDRPALWAEAALL